MENKSFLPFGHILLKRYFHLFSIKWYWFINTAWPFNLKKTFCLPSLLLEFFMYSCNKSLYITMLLELFNSLNLINLTKVKWHIVRDFFSLLFFNSMTEASSGSRHYGDNSVPIGYYSHSNTFSPITSSTYISDGPA